MVTRRVTLGDVARIAAVSKATVSRALRDDPQISEATRIRVSEIARQLGYVPNIAARNLVLQRSTTLGLMTPDVTDPIHGQIVSGFQMQAAAHGYAVILANGFYDSQAELNALSFFSEHQVGGVVLMGSVLRQDEAVQAAEPGIALFLEPEHLEFTGFQTQRTAGCIQTDNVAGMRQIAAHLMERGYHSIGYLGGSSRATDVIRRDALADALAEHDYEEPTFYSSLDSDSANLSAVAKRIQTNSTDVVVCYDDKTALNLVDALRRLGVSVPDDIGIVGFDDIPFARISNPRLTTVTQSSEQLGALSADMLTSAIDEGTLPESCVMPVNLIVRESTARPGSKPSGPHRSATEPLI